MHPEKNDAQEELRKEVERLRVQVELAARGISIVEEGDEPEDVPITDFLPAYVFPSTVHSSSLMKSNINKYLWLFSRLKTKSAHHAGHILCRDAVARGFTSPDDFTIKEGSLDYDDGSRYQGQVLGTLRHGRGTYTRADGATYSGEWRYDVLDGEATARMPDGQTYVGQWKKGRAHG